MNPLIQFAAPLQFQRGGLFIDFSYSFEGQPALGMLFSFGFSFDGKVLSDNS